MHGHPGGVDVSMIMTGAEMKKQGPSWKLRRRKRKYYLAAAVGSFDGG